MAREPEGAVVSESAWAAPAAPLRGLIAGYSGYRQHGVPPATHRGLPSPYLTLIITLDDPLTIASHPDPADPPGRYDTLAGGLHTTPALITHDGRQSGVQIALSPLGARALFGGMPAAELARRDLPATEVLGPAAAELHERLRQAASWPGRFALLDQVLLRRADLDRQPAADVTAAWRILTRSGGTIRASELAAETGWSPRYLQRRLRAETGLTPKAAARVTRFDRARRLLQRQAATGEATHLAGLAAQCGYYDQAHLAREFRALAGCAPSAWLAQEFRNFQAVPAGRRQTADHDSSEPTSPGLAHAAGPRRTGPDPVPRRCVRLRGDRGLRRGRPRRPRPAVLAARRRDHARLGAGEPRAKTAGRCRRDRAAAMW